MTLIITSCQESSFLQNVETPKETEEGLNLLEWYDILKKPNDGFLRLEDSRTFGSQDSPHNTAYLNGYFKDNSGKAIDYGTIEFGTIKMNPNEHNLYRSNSEAEYTANYGEPVTVKIKNEVVSFYLPKEIKFAQTDLSIAGNTEIHPGFVFKWNKDENNKLGVVIRIQYVATHNPHIEGAANGNIQQQNNYILTDDTGEYTFENKDFASIPNGAEVGIDIMRGGAVVMNTIEKKRIHLSGITLNSTSGVKVNLEK